MATKKRNPVNKSPISPSVFDRNYTVLDFETTGLKPNEGDILQASAITYSPAGKEIGRRNWLAKPQNWEDLKNNPVSGITRDWYKEDEQGRPVNYVQQDELRTQLSEYLGQEENGMIIAHNAQFESDWMNEKGINRGNRPMLDTLSLAKKVDPNAGRYSLDALRKRFQIQSTGQAHQAETDVQDTNALYQKLRTQVRVGQYKHYGEAAARANPNDAEIAFIRNQAGQDRPENQSSLNPFYLTGGVRQSQPGRHVNLKPGQIDVTRVGYRTNPPQMIQSYQDDVDNITRKLGEPGLSVIQQRNLQEQLMVTQNNLAQVRRDWGAVANYSNVGAPQNTHKIDRPASNLIPAGRPGGTGGINRPGMGGGGTGGAGGGGGTTPPASDTPAGQPGMQPRKPRVGGSTLDAPQLEETFYRGFAGLQQRGYLPGEFNAQEKYQLAWRGEDVSGPATFAAPYKEGPVQGAYGMHIRSNEQPDNRGLFLQVKGGFKTGQDVEGKERALQIVTEGGAEYSIGSLMRVRASGTQKEGNLNLNVERLSPEEHLALLVENAFKYAGNEESRGGIPRSTSAIFQELLTAGNATGERTPFGMRTPGGALNLSPNDAASNDAMRRRFASDTSVYIETSGGAVESEVYEELNRQLEQGTALQGVSPEMRAYRVSKEPERLNTPSGKSVDTDRYIARGIKYAQAVDVEEGTAAIARIYGEGKEAKYIYGFNKVGTQGGTMEGVTPMGEEVNEAGERFVRPLGEAPISGRVSATQAPPVRVRQTGMYGGAEQEFTQREVEAGIGFFISGRPGSGQALISPDIFRGPEGVKGYYTQNVHKEDLSFVGDLRNLAKDVQYTNAAGKTETGGIFQLLEKGTGRIRQPGERTDLFNFLEPTAEGGWQQRQGEDSRGKNKGPINFTNENLPYAMTGVTLNLPQYMTKEGKPFYGLPNPENLEETANLISTEALQAQLQERFAKQGMGNVQVTRAAKEAPYLAFETAVNTGVSNKGGESAEKAGRGLGPEGMGLALSGQAMSRAFGPNLPLQKISGESKSLVRTFMSGFEIMPREQQIELVQRRVRDEQSPVLEYMRGVPADRALSLTEIASRFQQSMPQYAKKKHRMTPEEFFQPILQGFMGANEEENVRNLQQFGIGRGAGWMYQGEASETTRFLYQTEARRAVAKNIKDRLVGSLPEVGQGGLSADYTSGPGQQLDMDYMRTILPERTLKAIGGNPEQLRRAAALIDQTMNKRLTFTPTEGRNTYAMSQYGEGMIMPYSNVLRPETPGGLRLGYETILAGVAKYPRAMVQLGLAPGQGPTGASRDPAKEAWTGVLSSALYRRAQKKGMELPQSSNVVNIDEDMASRLRSLVSKDNQMSSLSELGTEIERMVGQQRGDQDFKLGANTLLRYQGNGVDEYMPNPRTMEQIDFGDASGESKAFWATQYQNVTSRLMEATSGGGMSTLQGERDRSVVDQFYGRVEKNLLGRKSSMQRYLYGRTPHIGLSNRYQSLPGLESNEVLFAEDQTARIARKAGFRSTQAFYNYVNEQYGGRLPGMWFRQPTLGREGGMIGTYMVTPQFLQQNRGLKPGEIPTGASATGLSFVNPALATLFAGDFDLDPSAFILAMEKGKVPYTYTDKKGKERGGMRRALGYTTDSGQLVEESMASIDPGLARELNLGSKEYLGEMNRFLGGMFGQRQEKYDVMATEMEAIYAGVGANQNEVINDTGATFREATKSVGQVGRVPLSYLTKGVTAKALNDRIKGTSYNVMRALESFFVAGTPGKGESMNEAADLFSSMMPDTKEEMAAQLKDRYSQFNMVNRAVSSMAALYQPGLDLEVPLSEGVSAIESAFGSSTFSSRREDGRDVTNFAFRPNDRTRVVGGERRKNGFVGFRTNQSMTKNVLQTMANYFTQAPNMSNEALGLAFANAGDVEQVQKISEALSAIPHPGGDVKAGSEAATAYARARSDVLAGMITSGEVGEGSTAYHAMLAKGIRSAQIKRPDTFGRMTMFYGGKQMPLSEVAKTPEIRAGQTFYDIMTGHIPDLPEQALVSSGQYPHMMGDLARAVYETTAEGIGFTPQSMVETLAGATERPISQGRVSGLAQKLYSPTESTLDIRASQAYAVTNPLDERLQQFAPKPMRGWGNTGLFSTIMANLGVPEGTILSGSAATKRGTEKEDQVFRMMQENPEVQATMGEMWLGDSTRGQLELKQKTAIGTARFTGHTDVIGWMPNRNRAGELQAGGRMTIGDIKTTNIDKKVDALLQANKNMAEEEAVQIAQQEAYQEIAEKPEYQTQLGLYGHTMSNYLGNIQQAYQAAGGNAKAPGVVQARTEFEKVLRGRKVPTAKAQHIAGQYMEHLQTGAPFELGTVLYPAFTRGQGKQEQVVGVGSEAINVDWRQTNPEQLAIQAISNIRAGAPEVMDIARQLETVEDEEDYMTRQTGGARVRKTSAPQTIEVGKIQGSMAIAANAWLPDVQGNLQDIGQMLPQVVEQGEAMANPVTADLFRGIGQQLSSTGSPAPNVPPVTPQPPKKKGRPRKGPAAPGGGGQQPPNVPPVTPAAAATSPQGPGGRRVQPAGMSAQQFAAGGGSGGGNPPSSGGGFDASSLNINVIAKIAGRPKTEEERKLAVLEAAGKAEILNRQNGGGITNLEAIATQVAGAFFGGIDEGILGAKGSPERAANELALLKQKSPEEINKAIFEVLDRAGGPDQQRDALLKMMGAMPTAVKGVTKSFTDMMIASEQMTGPGMGSFPEGSPAYENISSLIANPLYANVAQVGASLGGIQEMLGISNTEIRKASAFVQATAPGATGGAGPKAGPSIGQGIRKAEWRAGLKSIQGKPAYQSGLAKLGLAGIDLTKGGISTEALQAVLPTLETEEYRAIRSAGAYGVAGASFVETPEEQGAQRLGLAISRQEMAPTRNVMDQRVRAAAYTAKKKDFIPGIVDRGSKALEMEIAGQRFGSWQELQEYALTSDEANLPMIRKQLGTSKEFTQAMARAKALRMTPQQMETINPELAAMVTMGQGVKATASKQTYVDPEKWAAQMDVYIQAMNKLDEVEKRRNATLLDTHVKTEDLNKVELERKKAMTTEAMERNKLDIMELRGQLESAGINPQMQGAAQKAAATGMGEVYERYQRAVNKGGDLTAEAEQTQKLVDMGKFGSRLNVSQFTRELFGGFGLNYLKNVLTMGVPGLMEGYQENQAFQGNMSRTGMRLYGADYGMAENIEQIAANRRINAGGSAYQQLRRVQAGMAGTAAGDISSIGSTALGGWLASQWIAGTMGTSVTATGALIGPGAGLAGMALPIAGAAALGMAGFQQYGKWKDMKNTQVNLAQIESQRETNGSNLFNWINRGWNQTGVYWGEAFANANQQGGFDENGNRLGRTERNRVDWGQAINAGYVAAVERPREIQEVGTQWLNANGTTGRILAGQNKEETQQIMQYLATNETGVSESMKSIDSNVKLGVAMRMTAAGLGGKEMFESLSMAEAMGRDVIGGAEGMGTLQRTGVPKLSDTLQTAKVLADATEEGFTKAMKGLGYAQNLGYTQDLFKGMNAEQTMARLTQLADIQGGQRSKEFERAWSLYSQQRDLGMNVAAPTLSMYASGQGEFTNEQKRNMWLQQQEQSRELGIYQNLITSTNISQPAANAFAQWGSQIENQMMAQQVMNRNPIAVAQYAMQKGVQEAKYFNTDVSRAGEVTGLNLYETSMALGNVLTPEQNAEQIWGADWQKSQVAQAAVMGHDITTSGGKTMHLEGLRGIQAMQLDLQAQQTRQSTATALKNWDINYAFTTGVGLQNYNTINPQTGQAFNLNKGPVSTSILGQSFTSQGGGAWGHEDANRWLGYQQQDWQYDFSKRQMKMQKNQFMEQQGLARKGTMMQRGWQQEDWQFQDWQRDTQWGWRVEDFQEEARFMTGRDRRKAEKQMKRETIMHTAEGEQIDKQRDREKEQWKLEDERFKMTIKHYQEQEKMQKEQMETQRKFYEEQKKLQEEQLQLQRASWTEGMNAQKESLQIQAAIAEKMIQLQKDMMALTLGIEDNNAKWTVAASTQSTFLDTLIERGTQAIGDLNDMANSDDILTDNKNKNKKTKPRSYASGGSLSRATLAEFGPELVRKEGSEYQVIPTHVTNPWMNTVVSNAGAGQASNKPITLVVQLGNDTLGRYVVDAVNDEIVRL